MRGLILLSLAVPALFACRGGEGEAETTSEAGEETVPSEATVNRGEGDGIAIVEVDLSNEMNMREFRVYRSDTASEEAHGELVNTIAGRGEGTHGPRRLTVREEGLEIGRRYYYRVELVRMDGVTSWTQPIPYVVRPEAETAPASSPEAS